MFSTVWKAKDNRNCIRHLVNMFSTSLNLGYIFEGILKIILLFTHSQKIWNIFITHKIDKLNQIRSQVEYLNFNQWTGLNRDPSNDADNFYDDEENRTVRESAMCLVSQDDPYFSFIFIGKLEHFSTSHLTERIPYTRMFTSKYHKTVANIFVIAFI